MEMMDSANLPFAQSTSELDNRFNGWNAPLFKVALCPREPSSCPGATDRYLDQIDSVRARSPFHADDQRN